MARMIAFIILLIPILMAGFGIKLMRDTLFGVGPIESLPLQFIVGIIFFGVGLWFIAGFLLHRDRKKGKVSERFMNRKKE